MPVAGRAVEGERGTAPAAVDGRALGAFCAEAGGAACCRAFVAAV